MYEVDFWNVSTSGKSGDAISLRFTDPSTGRLAVVVIDGGYAEFGDNFADKIRHRYQTDYVDLMISTHPDSDHINGLAAVIKDLRVGELLLHRPKTRGYDRDEVASDKSELLAA